MGYERNSFAPNCGNDLCFGYHSGKCTALVDNDFGNRTCPFFKTRERNCAENARCNARICEIKRMRKRGAENG